MWNIKDKIIDFRDFIKQTNIDSEIVKISFEEAFKKVLTTRFVTEENIEKLRLKLIDDFTGIGMPPLPREIVIEIVNKRFGIINDNG